jgi:hypothetical protein
VDPVPLRARRVHLLERDWRALEEPIEQAHALDALVAEHGAPERHHIGDDQRIDHDLNLLQRAGVSLGAPLPSRVRDPSGEVEVAFAQPYEVLTRRRR